MNIALTALTVYKYIGPIAKYLKVGLVTDLSFSCGDFHYSPL